MKDKVFKVTGKKVESLLFSEQALLFSSKSYQTVDDFTQAWAKTLILATKTEIGYGSIKSITKEDTNATIKIKYKGKLGISSDCAFSFNDPNDTSIFFDFLEKQQYFKRINEQLSPTDAILPYFLGLLFTIGITVFAHFEAIDIANGTAEAAHSGRARLFDIIIGLIGDKGVWTVGGLVTFYIVYQIWSRYKNPPYQTRLLPVTD